MLTLVLVAGAGALRAQDPAPQPAPAPAPAAPAATPAAPAAPAAPAVDSNEFYVGDWDFTAQMRDGSLDGLWRINYANGRFTGTVMIPGLPPSPISAMSVRDHFRSVSLTAYFNGESYIFTGHLDNPRTVTGSMQVHAGIGRLRAQKRG